MRVSTFLIMLVFSFAFVLTAAACGSEGDPEVPTQGNPNSIEVRWIHLGDGTEVRCVVYSDGYRGGVSCDWTNTRPVGRG